MSLKEYIQTEECKKKHLEKICGQNNGNYKGGITYNLKEYQKKYQKEYRKRNPEKQIIKCHNYRARLRNTEGSFTLKEWEAKKKEFNYKCAICGISEEALLNLTGFGLTVDHIMPGSKGGKNFISNIQPLCFQCNRKKGASINKVVGD